MVQPSSFVLPLTSYHYAQVREEEKQEPTRCVTTNLDMYAYSIYTHPYFPRRKSQSTASRHSSPPRRPCSLGGLSTAQTKGSSRAITSG